MTAHLSRLSMGVDPLISEAKQRMRRRRLLLATALGLLALAMGLTLSLRPTPGMPPPAASGHGSDGRTSYSPSQVKTAFAAEGIQLSKYGGHVQPPRGVAYLVSGMGIAVGIWIGHRRPSRAYITDSGWRLVNRGNLKLSWGPWLDRRVRAALARLG